MKTHDILSKPRLIAVGTFAGLTFAALNGCSGETTGTISPEVEKTIEANYDKGFVEDDGTACYQEVLDHSSISVDLSHAVEDRPWLDMDNLSDDIPATAEEINGTLEALHKEARHPQDASGNHPVQPGDVYSFCVNGPTDTLGAGDPINFLVTHE